MVCTGERKREREGGGEGRGKERERGHMKGIGVRTERVIRIGFPVTLRRP